MQEMANFEANSVEGAFTMALALLAPFILPDLPHNTKGFTEEERQVAQLRMTEDVGEADADSSEQGTFSGLFLALKDIKVYILMLVFTAYTVGLSFNAFFVSVTLTVPNVFSWLIVLADIDRNPGLDTSKRYC